jgi:hypothetical protein
MPGTIMWSKLWIRIGMLALAMLLGASPSRAALTSEKCLAGKLQAAGALRKCRATAEAKALLGKPADTQKCLGTFATKLAKLDAKAAKASVGCRFRDNGDGTITDFDTGLVWERKNSPDGIAYFPNPHDVDNLYTWSAGGTNLADGAVFGDLLARLNGSVAGLFDIAPCVASSVGAVSGGFAGHCDWRLPTIVELASLVDFTASGCGTGSLCLDPIFGELKGGAYLTSTTQNGNEFKVWYVVFVGPFFGTDGKGDGNYAMGVRGGW